MTSPKDLSKIPFAEVDGGHRLFLRDWGEGPPLLLLAGWGMDSRIWGEVMLKLNSAGFRTIAYDRRGHGRSTDPGALDYETLTDDLAAVLNRLDLDEVTLVAHSGAAGEAIGYVSRHGQERVRQIILVGATGPRMLPDDDAEGAASAMVDALCERLATDLAGWIDENVEPFAPGAPALIKEWMSNMVLDCSRRALVDFQRTIAVADLRAEVSALSLPVTLIHGDRDVSAPLDLTAREYLRLIPDAELLVYEGVAHGVMVTHPARLAADVAAKAGDPGLASTSREGLSFQPVDIETHCKQLRE